MLALAAYLVHRVDDPVDAGITTDGLVLRVDQDDFEVLVGRVLVDPVRVQHSQVGAAASNTFFGGGAERSLVLELVDTLVGGFSWKAFTLVSCPIQANMWWCGFGSP